MLFLKCWCHWTFMFLVKQQHRMLLDCKWASLIKPNGCIKCLENCVVHLRIVTNSVLWPLIRGCQSAFWEMDWNKSLTYVDTITTTQRKQQIWAHETFKFQHDRLNVVDRSDVAGVLQIVSSGRLHIKAFSPPRHWQEVNFGSVCRVCGWACWVWVGGELACSISSASADVLISQSGA